MPITGSTPDDSTPSTTRDGLSALLTASSETIWTAAALVLAADTSTTLRVRDAAEHLVAQRGVDVKDLPADELSAAAVRRLGLVLRKAAALADTGTGWSSLPDEVLLEQGRDSARGADLLSRSLLPTLTGLSERLAQPGAAMLDVGTGTAALAVSYARAFPDLRVVGIDVLPRALDLARNLVASSHVEDRIELRHQDVGDLTDDNTYDLAWIPAPFVPEPSFSTGLRAVVRSLRPGGWLLLGHDKLGPDPAHAALDHLQTAVNGGTAIADQAVHQRFDGLGLIQIRTVPTPQGAPAITVGRRPPTS